MVIEAKRLSRHSMVLSYSRSLFDLFEMHIFLRHQAKVTRHAN